jgi:GNAT superfamily N-acetyltransferase
MTEIVTEEMTDAMDIIEIVSFIEPEEPVKSWDVAEKNNEKTAAMLYAVFLKGKIFLSKDKSSGEIIGLLALQPDEMWWSTKRFISDLTFYVKEGYRKTGVGEDLLREAKKYAKEKNMPLAIRLFTGQNLQGKAKYLENNGFTQMGTSHWLI